MSRPTIEPDRHNTCEWTQCPWCDEKITGEAVRMPRITSSDKVEVSHYHLECHIRMILGGLNHLRRTCTCFGGTDNPDPDGVTRHEAAILVFEYWKRGEHETVR